MLRLDGVLEMSLGITTELLKGSSISDYEHVSECSVDGCKSDVTVIYLSKCYCSDHWRAELGFRKEK